MKTGFLFVFFSAVLFLHGCGESSLADSRLTLKLPQIPESWRTLIGDPYWQIEWINDRGQKQTTTMQGNNSLEIAVPQTWTSAVSAMPFWPEKGIRAGVFKPAGAIFPFDASGRTLYLSWQGGVDANLFRELALHYSGAKEEEDLPELLEQWSVAGERAAVSRLPHHFNWPRFRQLFDDESLNADIREDPWLADWSGIAAKIVESGFDKRRLVPAARSSRQIPVSSGPWIGTSPFAAPVFFESSPVFPVTSTIDTWVSHEGILRCNNETWIFISY